jgi:hypothetical protein
MLDSRHVCVTPARKRSVTFRWSLNKKRRSRFCLEPVLREAWPQVYPKAAICVQRFDDSLNSAIRITYRISLRSSSLREPRYPLLTVVLLFRSYLLTWRTSSTFEATLGIK